MNKPDVLSRRTFLKLGAGSALGAAGAASQSAHAERFTPGNEMRYRTLGSRTGLRVSEVGFGGYSINDPSVVHYAIDRGINYIDTAWDYRGGRSEEVLGKALAGKRDKVILTSKWHPWAKTKKSEMLEMLDTSLKRLRTDYLDCLLVHQVGKASGGESIERLENPELYEAYETAKKQGKVRFTGVSGHDGDLMDVMNWVIDKDYFDVILMRYNFLRYPEQDALIERAHAKGIGIIAMKTLTGAKGEDDPKLYRKGGASYKQAALKWVLSNEKLSNLIITISNTAQVDEYSAASGSHFAKVDSELLEYYAKTYGDEVCTMCNACEPHCPCDLPIANLLRSYMYFANYHQEDRGRLAYTQQMPQAKANICLSCSAPCEAHCPSGVKIRRELAKAERSLRLPAGVALS